MQDTSVSDFKTCIKEIKQKLPNRELIREFSFYEPEKEGISDYRGNCPSGHDSSSGQCLVVNEKVIYCHNCGRSWDQISLVQEFLTKGDFIKALFWCAKKVNVELPNNFDFKKYAEEKKKEERLLELFKSYVKFTVEAMDRGNL